MNNTIELTELDLQLIEGGRCSWRGLAKTAVTGAVGGAVSGGVSSGGAGAVPGAFVGAGGTAIGYGLTCWW